MDKQSPKTAVVMCLIEPAKGLAGFTPMPHTAMSDTGARCALNKTEGPLSWSQGPHYGTLVGTVTPLLGVEPNKCGFGSEDRV
jgi:hypothetical protein